MPWIGPFDLNPGWGWGWEVWGGFGFVGWVFFFLSFVFGVGVVEGGEWVSVVRTRRERIEREKRDRWRNWIELNFLWEWG